MRSYLAFCAAAVVAIPFPPTEATLCGFVAWCAWPRAKAPGGLAPDTMRKYVSAVVEAAEAQGVPAADARGHVLARVVRGFKKLQARPVRRKVPVTGAMLEAMSLMRSSSHRGLATWAAVCVTFAACARLGELVSVKEVPVALWSWIQVVSDDHWILTIPESKTDIFRRGATVHASLAVGPSRVPHLGSARGGHAVGRGPRRQRPPVRVAGGVVTKALVIRLLRAGVAAVAPAFGLPPSASDETAGHSLRRGAATSFLLAGVQPAVVLCMGRWARFPAIYQEVSLRLQREAALAAASAGLCGAATERAAEVALSL